MDHYYLMENNLFAQTGEFYKSMARYILVVSHFMYGNGSSGRRIERVNTCKSLIISRMEKKEN